MVKVHYILNYIISVKEVDLLPENAQNVKISSRAWELLRWAKFELESKSYSDVIASLNKEIQNRSKRLEKTLENFDEERHRIKTKTPEDVKSSVSFLEKPKTILLRSDAHKILSKLKLESNKPAYTFSDGIEFLIQENKGIWKTIPERLKK
jgi:predicted CopG family antitoxin